MKLRLFYAQHIADSQAGLCFAQAFKPASLHKRIVTGMINDSRLHCKISAYRLTTVLFFTTWFNQPGPDTLLLKQINL